MRYIEPPTKKQPKYLPPPGEPPENKWVRFLLWVGTIILVIVIFDIIT